jgi:hypothetical protein
MEYIRNRKRRILNRHWFVLPLLILPVPFLIILDLIIEVYHHLAFPLCNIALVKRSEYIIIFDRSKLSYLGPFQKLFCMYCGYANGLFLYQKEIAGRTEKYWCGIAHQNIKGLKVDQNHIDNHFAKFNDLKDFKDKYIAHE